MIVNGKLVDTGVKLGSKFNGAWQARIDRGSGDYWEANHKLSNDEQLIQWCLTRKDMPPPNKHVLRT